MVIKLDPVVDNSAELFRRKQAADKLASEKEDEGVGSLIGGLLGAAGGFLVGNAAGVVPGFSVGSQIGKGAVAATEDKVPDIDAKTLLQASSQLAGASSAKDVLTAEELVALEKKKAAEAAIKSLNLGGKII